LDSGTLIGDGDATAGTIENEGYGCNIGSLWFNFSPNNAEKDRSLKGIQTTQDHDISRVDTDFTYNSGSFESSFDENPSNDEPQTPTLNQAIDNAIRDAGTQNVASPTNQSEQQQHKIEVEMVPPSSPTSIVLGSRKNTSPIASPHRSPLSARVSSTNEMHPEANGQQQQPVEFHSLMNIAASKLDKITEMNSPSNNLGEGQSPHDIDRYSSPRDRDEGNENRENMNQKTPKIQNRQHFFEAKLNDTSPFSDSQFDLLSNQAPVPKVSEARSNTSKQQQTPTNADSRFVHDLTHVNEHLDIDERNETKQAKKKTIMDQGRFLLEKDDAYWDTLSTIASTANERSLESDDEYMDEIVKPGPIPGEITTSSSDIQYDPDAVPIDAEKYNYISNRGQARIVDKHKRNSVKGISQSQANLNDMMNDVTDLIDADLLDRLPPSKNNIRTSIATKSSGHGMKPMATYQPRPTPETMGRPQYAEQSYEGNLNFANAASQIAKKISWGIEEIFEDTNDQSLQSDQLTSSYTNDNSGYTNDHSVQSDQYTTNSEGTSSFSFARKEQPSPELMQKLNHRPSLHSKGTRPKTAGEEDLLSRTLKLSKGLLETIMGSQVMQEKEERERHYDGRSNANDRRNLIERRDDPTHQERKDISKNYTDIASPGIQSRLELLRMQRSEALEKFRLSQDSTTRKRGGVLPLPSKKIQQVKRDRDRLKNYKVSHELGKAPITKGNHVSSTKRDRVSSIFDRAFNEQTSYSEDSDIELKYTTSESNASITPSQKARDLRIQIDEAMKASRAIQMSQNQLGSELNTFKQRYYKNPFPTRV